MAIKKVLLQKKIGDAIYDVYPKTSSDVVVFTTAEGTETTVAAQLQEVIEGLAGVITADNVDQKIKDACDATYNKVMGIAGETTTVNEAYDTLVEVATYIEEHGDVVTGIMDRITALEGVVGDETKGLVKDVADIKSDIEAMDYSKVVKSETNGNVMVDGEEVVVYTHPETHDADMIVDDTSAHKFVTADQLAVIDSAAAIQVVTEAPTAETAVANDLYMVEIG